jgi:lipoprotein-releasing system ATP-binding protein
VGSMLLDLARQERTILVLVTHSTDLAARLPSRMRLTDGRLQAA